MCHAIHDKKEIHESGFSFVGYRSIPNQKSKKPFDIFDLWYKPHAQRGGLPSFSSLMVVTIESGDLGR